MPGYINDTRRSMAAARPGGVLQDTAGGGSVRVQRGFVCRQLAHSVPWEACTMVGVQCTAAVSTHNTPLISQGAPASHSCSDYVREDGLTPMRLLINQLSSHNL